MVGKMVLNTNTRVSNGTPLDYLRLKDHVVISAGYPLSIKNLFVYSGDLFHACCVYHKILILFSVKKLQANKKGGVSAAIYTPDACSIIK